MADQTLVNLRNTLQSTAQSAWDGQEGARQALEDSLDQHDQDIEDCIDSPDARDCLEDLFEENDIGGDIQGDWDGSDFAEIITSLRDLQRQWSSEARGAVREIAASNDLQQLHRWCMTGRVGDVADEIGASGVGDELQAEYGFSSPSSARECMQAVALVKDVRADLQEAWGTAQ